MALQYDVFISYRRSDGKELAKAVRDYLTKKGLRVFLDTEEMVKGQFFDEQIRYHVTNCPNYIFIGTPDAFAFRTDEFDYVAEEIRIAVAEHDKSPETRYLVPVMTAGTQFPPESAFPEGTAKIAKCDALFLKGDMPTDKEYREILKYVTVVNKHNLWNAGKRWLEESKSEGARFASLHIEKTIMPNAKKSRRKKDEQESELPINVYRKESDSEGHSSKTEQQSLLNAFGSTQGHLYLIGDGGIGKTTALIKVMNDAYEDDENGTKQYTPTSQVPLFVELSRAPDTNDKNAKLYTNGHSTFIRRAIYQQIRRDRSIKQIASSGVGELDEAFTASPEVAVFPVNDLLTKQSNAPEYLLLLDGLNEASRVEIDEAGGLPVVTMLIGEILWLIDNCPNVRIVLTSRTDETAISDDRITRLYLSGLDDAAILEYLKAQKLPAKRIEKAKSNTELWEELRIPLFLTMYATLSGKNEVTSRGEILRMFFSERRENLDVYTAQRRIAEVDQAVQNAASVSNPRRIDERMQNFMLDFMLPEIAWTMERNGDFYLDAESIAKIIEPVLTDYSDTAVCGRYGKTLFDKYQNGASVRVHTQKTAKTILKKLGDDITEVTENILECCVFSLGIMQKNKGEYGFEHQHIRDYFAAVRNVNSLRLAVYSFEKADKQTADACLDFMKTAIITPEVRRFMGEFLGENKNAPVLDNGVWHYNIPIEPEDRNLLKRAMDTFRGRFGKEVGYGVYNLIEILKSVRGDLSAEDLSLLDLTQITLNGTDLGERGGGVILTGSKVGHNNLFPVGHTSNVESAAYSPDGNYIITASWDKTAKIWDALTGTLLMTLQGHSENLCSAAYSHDGKFIVTASWDRTAKVWDSSTGTLLRTITGHSDTVRFATFSPNGKFIITASCDKTAKVWDALTGSLLLSLDGHIDSVLSAIYSPDGNYIITASTDSTSKIWDASNGLLLRTLKGHKNAVTAVAYSPDGKHIVTGSSDNTAKVWNASTGLLLKTLEEQEGTVISATYSPNGKYVVVASNKIEENNSVTKIYNASTGKLLRTLARDTYNITSVNYSLDGKHIITTSDDNTAKIWDALTGSLQIVLDGRTKIVTSATYSPDGKHFITSSCDRTAKIFEASTGSLLKFLIGHDDYVTSANYSPDCKYIVTASCDKTAKVWDSSSGLLLKTLEGHNGIVTSAKYSSNGQYIVTTSFDHTAKVWNASTGMILNTLTGHQDTVTFAEYSPDGKYIVTASYDHTAKVWDASTGELLRSLYGHSNWVTSASYSPDGKYIVTTSCDKVTKVWDASTGTLLRNLLGHMFSVESAEYSPDGKNIVTASNLDKNAIVWDALSGARIWILFGHSNYVTSASYSPNNQFIITASLDSTVKVWNTEIRKCVETIPNIPGLRVVGVDLRNLHPDSMFSDEDKEILRRYGAIVD